jgi:hypothetical protein
MISNSQPMSNSRLISNSKRHANWMRFVCGLFLALSLGSCAMDEAITSSQMREIANVPPNVVATVAQLQPGMVDWYRDVERAGLAIGQPLDADQMRLAQAIGVTEPDRVRVVIGHEIPLPPNPQTFKPFYDTFGNRSLPFRAMTFGHAIYIFDRTNASKRWLMAHELTHVTQFEKLGMDGFAHDYLLQRMLFGYSNTPLERAAIANERLGKQ